MPANLTWEGNELKLGPFTVDKVKKEGAFWAAEGSKDLVGLLKDLWQDEEDARQDVEVAVRTILRRQGVKVV